MKELSSTVTKKDQSSIKNFIRNYFDELNRLLLNLRQEEIMAFIEELESAREKGNTVFIIGNGGSAATASHMANDFGVNLFTKNKGDKPLRALSLTDNAAVMLALANDEGYENIFVYQLKVYFKPGDKLIAISASGNSPNVVEAAQWVKEQEGRVISLVGFDGGRLGQISDIVIHAETEKGKYGPVEDVHMIIDHLVTDWFLQKKNPEVEK